ncbi:hypothetical protein O0L34_g9635 [Tuta absoluta]|nr:hypothetical protein O0L34_g9635 [Tuta absoluta]
MSSRGRGYGGYGGRGGTYSGRGGGYRGSYRGNNRGSYEGRGGRGGGGYSYNNDSRYNSSSGNRYSSSRDRIDDSYKKTYRSESSAAYSTREYGGRSGSPERKRMRIEGSSSDRRSHDGGGHFGSSYGRQESYGGERRSFGGEDRRRSPTRESYRKPSGMGPPRDSLRTAMRPRAPRRSFRGRTMRSRATYRGAPRSRGAFASRRYGDRSLGYTRAFRPMKRGSSPVKSKDDEEASSTEEDWDADEKEEEIAEEKKEVKSKSPKPEAEGSDAGNGEAGDETDKEAEEVEVAPPPRRNYVHLACVHCKEKCATFASYTKHLMSNKHRLAMGSVARRHKAQLLRMRLAQRGAQRELEAGGAAPLAPRTAFCLVCRLNHRTTRHAHNLTDTHRAMKRFLMPFCRVCRVAFRSPMLYEHHICSLEHLKRKASNALRRSSPKPDEEEGSGDEGMDVDLDNFMTLDSVGDVDEVEDDDSGGEKKEEAAANKPKVEINIGNEHIKKLQVLFCELCQLYLPRHEPGSAEEAEAARRHCRLRRHLSRYVQHRDTRTLRKQAERIHRQLHQQRGMYCRATCSTATRARCASRPSASTASCTSREVCTVALRAAPRHAHAAQAGRAHPPPAAPAERYVLSRYVQHRDTRTLRKQAERIHRQLHQQRGMYCRATCSTATRARCASRPSASTASCTSREVCTVALRAAPRHAHAAQAGRAHPPPAAPAERYVLSRYVQHRDTRTLRKQAERIHRQLHQQRGMYCRATCSTATRARCASRPSASTASCTSREVCTVALRAAPRHAHAAQAGRAHPPPAAPAERYVLSRYVQHRDTRTLRKQAERIHRQLHQQREEQKENAENAAVKEVKAEAPADDSTKKLENGTDAANASGSEDKLWADVDKDLGELLSEVDPQGHEGSDDEEDLGRYDKFRKSDKKSKAADGEEGEEVNAADDAAETKSNEIDAPA